MKSGFFLVGFVVAVVVAADGMIGCVSAVSPTPSSIQSQPTQVPTVLILATPTIRVVPTPTLPATPISSPTASSINQPQATAQPKSLKTYSSSRFHVSLRYPVDWQVKPGYEERYEGSDGFFALGAGGGELSIDKFTENEANHKLKPYGSNPTIERLTVQGQDARLILPSSDQPKEMKGQAGLIVRAPRPIQIDKETYNYLVLWADKDHIREIIETLRFT